MDDSPNSSGEYSDSIPVLPIDSPGSSVSTRLQDEYDELLKYAVVVPTYDPKRLTRELMESNRAYNNQDNFEELSDGALGVIWSHLLHRFSC